MQKKILPLIVALVGGGVGFGLRKWQLTTGFEPDTGLAVTNAPAALALLGWSALVAVAVLALIRPGKPLPPREQALASARENPVYLTAVVLAAFLLAVSAAMELLFPETVTPAWQTALARTAAVILPPLRIALCVCGLPGALLWARSLYRGGEGSKESLPLLILCLLFCVWLISDYQTRAADPVTMLYLYELLAIVCDLLGLYYLAGYSFETGKPRRAVLACLMGAYFSLVTLADPHGWADMARYGFALLFLTAHAAVLLNPGEAPAEAETVETEADDHG